MTYQERIHPSVAWWLAGVFLVASVAVAVFAYVPPWLAVTLVVLSAALITVGLLAYTLRIDVRDGHLRVGRNVLEGNHVADAEVVPEGAPTPADHGHFLLTRPFARELVRVVIDDPADPYGAWLVSTNRADELCRAVRGIRGQ